MAKKGKRPRWKKIVIVFASTLVVVIGIGLALAAIYKKEIISLINDQLRVALHTEATIGDAHVTFLADFPNISLVLHDVIIGRDSVSGKEVLKAKRIELNLRMFKLLMSRIEFRSINVEDANIFIFKTSGGYSNLDVFKSAGQTADTANIWKRPALPFERQHLVLKNVHFAFYDSLREKYYDLTLRKVDNRFVNRDSLVDITMKGPIDFGKLEFNPAKGALLRNATTVLDIKALLHRDSSFLEILPSRVKAAGADVDVLGSIRFRGKKRMELHFSTEKIEYGKGLAILPDSLALKLSRLSVANPVKVNFTIVSTMIPRVKPAIDLDFVLTNNVVTGKYIELRKLSVHGHMSNHVNDDLPYDNANTLIHLSELQAELDGLPFRAEVKLFDPSDITMELHSIHAFDLTQLNNQVDTTAIRFSGGQISSEFMYNGKLREYLDPNTTKYTGRLDGKMSIRDGKFRLIGRSLDFSNLHASVRFNQDTVQIDGIGVRNGKNSVEVTGMLVNYVPLFLKPQEKGLVKLNVKAPFVDLATFVATKKQRQSVKKSDEQKDKDRKKISDMLDLAFKNLRFDLRFNVDEFQNKNFAGSKLTGQVTMKGTSLEAKNIRMNFARGELVANASMKELQKSVNPVEVTTTMKNVHFKELFLAFNNFGQKTITDENIHGSVSMDARLKMSINDELNVILPTLKGDVNLTVHEGRLVNVEPLQKMGNFLFKKRDFDDVQFAQINCHFNVTNRDLDIDKMKVESTVLTLYIEGKYSMDANTDLTIQVPLSNLKRRDKSYKPQNVEDDGKIGPSVFLRAQTNAKGETNLSYDPFNKRRKKKNKG
jgi:hypothetical protein